MAKICVLCSEDCSDRQRVKDAHGRYYCKSCHDDAVARSRAKASAPAPPPPPPPPPGDLLLETVSRACPSCGWALQPGAVLCTNCGYDTRIGRAVGAPQVVGTVGGLRPTEGGGRVVWPLVLGVLAMVFAGIGITVNAMDIALTEDPRERASTVAASVLPFVLSGVHLIGGLNLIRRRRLGISLLRVWAWITVVLSALAVTCLSLFSAIARERIAELEGFEDMEGAIGLFIALIIALALWPIFLLVWFGRASVQYEYESW